MSTGIRLYSLTFSQAKTYIITFLFIAGNILLPFLCHSIPQGGAIFLPIYFFTFLGAYKYGLKPGLLIAVLSPVLNHLLTGMPPLSFLPVILGKSCLLAIAASYTAKRFQKLNLVLLTAVVLFYQSAGFFFEWGFTGDLFRATQDIRLALPGILIQIFGIYGILKVMKRFGY